MTQFSKQIALALVMTAGVGAWADTSPDFSYPSAQAAFATATAPTAAAVTGTWLMVGRATTPGQDTSTDGYWPNGEYQIAGEPGYFKRVVTIASTTDAFGNVALTYTISEVGVETGHVYSTFGPYAGAVIPNDGLTFDTPFVNNVCAETDDCRLTANNMLLCGVSVIQSSDDCYRFQSGDPVMFNGLVKQQ